MKVWQITTLAGVLVTTGAFAITQNNTTGLTQNGPSYRNPGYQNPVVTTDQNMATNTGTYTGTGTTTLTNTVTNTVTNTGTNTGNIAPTLPRGQVRRDGTVDMGTYTATGTNTNTSTNMRNVPSVPRATNR